MQICNTSVPHFFTRNISIPLDVLANNCSRITTLQPTRILIPIKYIYYISIGNVGPNPLFTQSLAQRSPFSDLSPVALPKPYLTNTIFGAGVAHCQGSDTTIQFKSKLHPSHNNLVDGCKLVQQLVKFSIQYNNLIAGCRLIQQLRKYLFQCNNLVN